MSLSRMNQEGQSLTEYLMLLILVSLGAMTATVGLGRTVISKISKANARLSSIHFETVDKKGGSAEGGSEGSSMMQNVKEGLGMVPEGVRILKDVADIFKK